MTLNDFIVDNNCLAVDLYSLKTGDYFMEWGNNALYKVGGFMAHEQGGKIILAQNLDSKEVVHFYYMKGGGEHYAPQIYKLILKH